MATPAMTKQMENGELPDNLDYNATWQTFSSPEARELDIPEEIWAEALHWAGIPNVVTEPTYDYHISSMGKWQQDVCIDFTTGLSPTGDIMFEAIMYKAKITRKESVTYRDEKLCKAFILWKPACQLTTDCITGFIRHNR